MTGQAKRMIGGMLRTLCALAILSLAFAHKPPQVIAAVIQSAGLQLPDGSYADICVSDSAIKHPAANSYCEACRLAAATLLPVPDDQSWLISHVAGLVMAPLVEDGIVGRLPIDRPRSRAPPAFS